MSNYLSIKNNQCVKVADIPVLGYGDFLQMNAAFAEDSSFHCVSYFGMPAGAGLRLFCCMADDFTGTIRISSSIVNPDRRAGFPSLTARHLSFHCFERELHEDHGIRYSDHPWLKPIRYPFSRHDRQSDMTSYPFYSVDSEELHEVGVGPVHAGIIEPGHFRFICDGEQVLHLEIQLGYQHRGVESLFLQHDKLLQRTILAESIAGDTVVGHALAFVSLWESLCGYIPSYRLMLARTIASELERIAIHTGDLSAICTDIAYQLGSSVFGRLRTPVVNTFQEWCGNRLAKGLIRAGVDRYPLVDRIRQNIIDMLDQYEADFSEMYERMKNLPGVLARLERTGILTTGQAYDIGAVGMSARASGLMRDIRWTHPYALYGKIPHQPVIKHHGDVYSRTQIRHAEIIQSVRHIRRMLEEVPCESPTEAAVLRPVPGSFSLSLTEGWRGEICHCAITGDNGELIHYKIKDPSLHNWMALALAVRNNEISDFPICNKSFNLSYCGHDL